MPSRTIFRSTGVTSNQKEDQVCYMRATKHTSKLEIHSKYCAFMASAKMLVVLAVLFVTHRKLPVFKAQISF